MGPPLPGLGSLHRNRPLLPPTLLVGLLRVSCMPRPLANAKTGRDGGEWWISPPSSCSLVPSDTMAWCSQLTFSGPGGLQQGGTRPFCTVGSCQYSLCPHFPQDSISRQGWFQQGRLGAILTMWVSVTSLFSHWCCWGLFQITRTTFLISDTQITWRSTFWTIILKWQFWLMVVQALLWKAGVLCLSLSLQASWSNVLVIATGFKGFYCLICIYLK